MFNQLFKVFSKKTPVNILILVGTDFIKTHSDIYYLNNKRYQNPPSSEQELMSDEDLCDIVNEKEQVLQIDTNSYLFDLVYSPLLLLQKKYEDRLSVITSNIDGIISANIKDCIELYGNINSHKNAKNEGNDIDTIDLYNYLQSYMDMDQKPSFLSDDSVFKNQLINAYLLSQHSDLLITLGLSKHDTILQQIFTYGKRFSDPLTIDFGSSLHIIDPEISFKFDKDNQFTCYDDLKSITNMIIEIDDGLNKRKTGK